MARSMLSGYAIQQLRRSQADIFATGLKEADPQIRVLFEREDFTTGQVRILNPQQVLVRFRHDKKLIRVYGGLTTRLATSPTELDGMFMAFEPFDVATGDRFDLQGRPGRIIEVWPPRNGKRRAAFTIEGDARPA